MLNSSRPPRQLSQLTVSLTEEEVVLYQQGELDLPLGTGLFGLSLVVHSGGSEVGALAVVLFTGVTHGQGVLPLALQQEGEGGQVVE